MSRSFVFLRLFGIEVGAHWSWIILAILIVSSLATGWFPLLVPGLATQAYWIAGLLGALGLFASIVVHEFSHALVGRAYKLPMRRITLFLFGGVADLEDEPPSPKAEFLMAIAGPAASVVLTGVFAVGFTLAVDNSSSELLQALLSYLASINLIVAVFNMLPGYPLDGGRVLRSALWAFKKDIVWATRIASTIGQGFGFLLILLGLFSIARGQPGSGLWSSLLGFLLLSLARASYVQVLVKQTLHGKPAEDFMNTEPSIVHPETTITHLMQLALNQPDANLTPVIHPDGRFLGCADLKEARKIPEKEWSSHFVHEIIQPCRKETSIAPDTDAEKALTQMAQTGTGELLVIRDGHLLGVLTRSALLRYLSFRRT